MILVAAAGLGAGAPAAGQAFDPAYESPATRARRPEDVEAGARVSVFREPTGKTVLVVSYPWEVHTKPSLEVRLLGPEEPDDERIHPMYFRWKHMKGDTTVAVYRTQDQSENAPVRAVSREAPEFEILGARNSLTKPAVCAVRWFAHDTESGKKAQPGAGAAFPLLDAWSVNEKTLYLDLPGPYFDAAGPLRVWLLRDDRVVWSETLSWPGLKTPERKGEE